ncbi:hypothetical protein B0I37DRAFT_357995 [Chaetomium sp. MPI-CAGE-AT-0009]|nr:hypothetical protein B0I37DRAFT_357995 [Chaetomium sp. MPI-CAGE-AT-0009]
MASRTEPAQRPGNTVLAGIKFARFWPVSTADNNITIYGFRRFKTAHLVNLRFLEPEIDALDDKIYQAGFSMSSPPSPTDRLGLKHSKRDSAVPPNEDVITRELVLQLRDLTRDYDDALLRLNTILSIDTLSLIDDAT